jgi:ATP-dependent RNA helicase DeaD
VAVYGGKPIRGQIDKLARGAEIVIGTPGRVLDHMGRGTLKLDGVTVVILDEADRMLDIGFRPDIEKILRRCPRSRQTLLLSATVPPPVERLARSYMRDPETLNFSPKDISVETIEQFYCTVEQDRKFELLEHLLKRESPAQAIVFCRTKRGTDRLGRRLTKRFASVACIHGDLPQSSRDRVMAAFRGGKVRVLVATDVVGRGIDVTGISHIFNYDIPQFCDDYVHRVGRTGRMGREGVAYTFVTPEEGNELTRIEMRIDRLLKRDDVPGFAVTRAVAAASHPAPDGSPEAAAPEAAPAEKKTPLYGRGGRPIRRIRRAL